MSKALTDKQPAKTGNSLYSVAFQEGKKKGYTEGYAAAVKQFAAALDHANTTLLAMKSDGSGTIIGKTVREVNPGNPLINHPIKDLGVITQARGIERLRTIGDIPNLMELQMLDGVRTGTIANIRRALENFGLILPDCARTADGMEN